MDTVIYTDTLTCRILTSADFELTLKLWENKKSLFKIGLEELPGYSENLKPLLEKYLDGSDSHMNLYGVFSGNTLVGTWGAFKWKAMPYFTLADSVVDERFSSPSRYKLYVNIGLEKVLSDMHLNGRFQFYFLTLARDSQQRSLKAGTIKTHAPFQIFNKYDFFFEAFIPKGKESPFSGYKSLMHNKTYPKDLWIRKGILKLEFMLPYLSFEG